MRPINPVYFKEKKYFFTFTDDFMQYMEVYRVAQKSECFLCLKAFYSFCKTRSQKDCAIKRIQSNYGLEL